MTTTIRAGSARDFLSLLPSMLGYVPTNSLVLVGFSGPRTVGVMRIDLPDDTVDTREYAATVIGYVCKIPNADGVAAVVYTGGNSTKILALLNHVLVRGNDCGLDVKDLLFVADDGWGSLLEGGAAHALDELTPHEEAPAYVAGDQKTTASLPNVDATTAQAFADALVEAKPAGYGDGALDLFERVTSAAVSAADLADLAVTLERPALRDIAIAQWCYGTDRGQIALDAQLAYEEGTPYPEELAKMMWGDAPRPHVGRLAQVQAHLRTIAALVPAAGTYATLGWISWALGRSSEAEVYLREALETDPEHGLAKIMLTIIAAGHLPEWAFRGE